MKYIYVAMKYPRALGAGTKELYLRQQSLNVVLTSVLVWGGV